MNTVVSTGDKDLAQLVNDKVMLINTMSNEKLDEAGVLAKFGVPPNRIIDYLTLIGDTVDNVPGVSKCGPKTALKWLAPARLAGRRDRERPQHHRRGRREPARALEWLPKGRELITVKTDCDLSGHMVSIEETLVGRRKTRTRCATSSSATASRPCCANWVTPASRRTRAGRKAGTGA
jgi:DNA polymerase-1